MPHMPITSTFVFTTWIGRVLSAGCDPVPPLALPITDIKISSSIANSFMRGIPVNIGTPPQSIVVLPWPDLNNTSIYDEQSNCDSSIIWNDQICEIRRGGYFLETESTTFTMSADLIAAGGTPNELNTPGIELGVSKLLSTSLAGTETLTTGPNITKALTIPIGIPRLRWDNGYTMLHAMGMGSNSTFLHALVAAGQISSRVWSIWWGRMWTETNAMDGSLVLGGYDKEKVTGRNVTLPLDYTPQSGCWTGMKVTVSNLMINFRNGTDVGILPRNSALQFCIVPQRQLLMEAPNSIVDTFQNATKMTSIGTSFGLHWNSRLFNASSNIFDGDVTFVLNDGLDIRVSNSQFFVPFVDVDRGGVRNVDRTKKELVMFGVGEELATLGRYFLTAAYLMVNHDERTFTMWQANPTTKSSLVAVQREGSQTRDCGSSGGSVDTFGEGSDRNTNRDGGSPVPESAPLSTSMIAGIAVGGVVVLASIIAAIFIIRRRKCRNMATKTEATPPGYDQVMASGDGFFIVDQNSPQEIAGSFPGNPNKRKSVELRAEQRPQELHGSLHTYLPGRGPFVSKWVSTTW
ncbi:aspartic peptidase domain-containing protein [Apiosordaria backusii]|uniref:Aspartic peptidase domain-containing protein n=1 Tax=Apiosordaria backusii TaxID=314023 RepID=A0AA40DZC6_9PEZI|nr:aspartic peptidase domain-containing protein [Apiosordaria backusii]